MRHWKQLSAIAALSFATSAAYADTLTFKATLSPSAEVPPVSSPASGQGTFSYDTDSKELQFSITYRGLGSSVTGSHIHGPARPGANANIVRTFVALDSPISGQIRLTDAQVAELNAGQLYVDVHSSDHPQGEIRGQISK